MNRYDLKGFAPAKMAEHIRKGQANRAALAQAADPKAALGHLMDRANFIWAVWPETDKRKASVLGHGLAIVKGIPLLQRISDRSVIAQLEETTILFDSHSSACGASILYGDDKDEAAA